MLLGVGCLLGYCVLCCGSFGAAGHKLKNYVGYVVIGRMSSIIPWPWVVPGYHGGRGRRLEVFWRMI